MTTPEDRHDIGAGACVAAIVLAVMILGSALGCATPAPALEVPAEVSPAPSCPCGDKCECVSLKEQLAAKDTQLETVKAIVKRLENNANVLAGEIETLANDKRYRVGDKISYDSGATNWEVKWVKVQKAVSVKSVLKQQPATQSNAYMSPCGPKGCSPRRGLFGW